MKGDPSPDKILQLGMAFWGSKTLLSAIELGVFSELGRGPLDAKALAERIGVHPRSARDFFDALVALGLLERRSGIYENRPEADRFLDRAKPSYVGSLLEMANSRLYGHWASLSEALRTGEPQNELRAGGKDLVSVLYQDPARLRGFLRAMTAISTPVAMTLAERFPWAEYHTFADIGTAEGLVPVELARAHRHLSGIGFDLAPVAPVFSEYVRERGFSSRVSFVAGDFFEDPLPRADVLVMGHILHALGLEEKRALLARALEALPPGGALIVYEALIDDERRVNAFGLLMSLNMLIETPRGFDFTGEDCRGWMAEAGFRSTRVEHLVGPDSMVVGIK